jgi:hypothetical protein
VFPVIGFVTSIIFVGPSGPKIDPSGYWVIKFLGAFISVGEGSSLTQENEQMARIKRVKNSEEKYFIGLKVYKD